MISYPNAELRIFDRYGKLLKELRPTSLGWDGTFNGQELPASDYWYVFKMDATAPEKRGHFSLKR
jgi:gliding motility-associated-like protein